MAPMIVEVYGQEGWIRAGKIYPGAFPGSVADNKPDGTRELYIFECEKDDSKSTIYRSKRGVDATSEIMRISTTVGKEEVKELKKGDNPYEMEIMTDESPEPRRVRFRHV